MLGKNNHKAIISFGLFVTFLIGVAASYLYRVNSVLIVPVSFEKEFCLYRKTFTASRRNRIIAHIGGYKVTQEELNILTKRLDQYGHQFKIMVSDGWMKLMIPCYMYGDKYIEELAFITKDAGIKFPKEIYYKGKRIDTSKQ